MNSKIFLLAILSVALLSFDKKQNEETYLVDYVNPLMGTDSKYSLSNGNTYPAIATPWGMNFWTP